MEVRWISARSCFGSKTHVCKGFAAAISAGLTVPSYITISNLPRVMGAASEAFLELA